MRKMFKPSPKQSGGFIGGCKCHSKHERCPMHGTKFATVERRCARGCMTPQCIA
jgi:hypothetical protein